MHPGSGLPERLSHQIRFPKVPIVGARSVIPKSRLRVLQKGPV